MYLEYWNNKRRITLYAKWKVTPKLMLYDEMIKSLTIIRKEPQELLA